MMIKFYNEENLVKIVPCKHVKITFVDILVDDKLLAIFDKDSDSWFNAKDDNDEEYTRFEIDTENDLQ